jgi:Na+/H+ antiporter NhaD/arsenite permease-like protein
MKKHWIPFLSALLLVLCLLFILSNQEAQAQNDPLSQWVVGRVLDDENQPISGATISLGTAADSNSLSEATSQLDGSYDIVVPSTIPDQLFVRFERAHFKKDVIKLDSNEMDQLRSGQTLRLPDKILSWRISPAFWFSVLIFIVVLVLIATDYLHNTLAALVGASLIFAASYLDHLLKWDLFIFNFQGAQKYIDWDVIFLIMGMMIVIAIVENTGIFQWLAFSAYRVSGGRTWLLLPILMLITGVSSAFLDNITTMLLMTPMTMQIAIALGINPLSLLIPELMASNVIGVSTLIGTPTNILIGSYANISFTDFLSNLTPGVFMAFFGLLVYSGLIYHQDLSDTQGVSPELAERLEERGKITNPRNLRKVGIVGAGMIALFVTGENFNFVPAITALMGATTLLIWIRPNIEEMIEAVDWTTLVFFIALFIVVGAVQEVGFISILAKYMGQLVGKNITLAMLAVVGLGAILSSLIANIPFTAAMLPVIGLLSTKVPGADSKVLFYCLSIGSAFGGNGSLIGASANMVTAGIAKNAGYPLSYMYFLKRGLPAMFITIGIALAWLFFRF